MDVSLDTWVSIAALLGTGLALWAATSSNIHRLRTELKSDLSDLRTELKHEIGTVRTDIQAQMRSEFSEVNQRLGTLEQRTYDLKTAPRSELR